MNRFISTLTEDRASRNVALATIAIVLFTTVHHIYGGILYDTSWRIIMSLAFFLPMLALTIFLQYLSIKKSSRVLLIVFVALNAFMWAFNIGIGEGGYNHTLKNILYFGGAPESLMNTMFPPEMGGVAFYEKPNDFLFESTGIATTVFTVPLVYWLVVFLRKQWKRIAA